MHKKSTCVVRTGEKKLPFLYFIACSLLCKNYVLCFFCVAGRVA